MKEPIKKFSEINASIVFPQRGDSSKGIQIVREVAMSYLAEKNANFKPVYIPVPKKLEKVFVDVTLLLLCPYEWTIEQARDYVSKDAEAWKTAERGGGGSPQTTMEGIR